MTTDEQDLAIELALAHERILCKTMQRYKELPLDTLQHVLMSMDAAKLLRTRLQATLDENREALFGLLLGMLSVVHADSDVDSAEVKMMRATIEDAVVAIGDLMPATHPVVVEYFAWRKEHP